MDKDKESIRAELIARVDQARVQTVIMLALAWLFSAFSYLLTKKTGTDWFTRSGSMMGLMGAIATFRFTGIFRAQLVTAFREGLGTVQKGIEYGLDPPPKTQRALYFSYLTGIVGTVIWGYGDVLSRWVSQLLG